MAFLFVTSFYLFTVLFYSISCSLSIGRAEGSSVDWSYGSNIGLGGLKAAAPSFGVICKRYNFIRSQKLICLLCKGLDPACLTPLTTTEPSTTPTSTTVLPTTTPSTTTPISTAASTTIPTTTTTTAAPAE